MFATRPAAQWEQQLSEAGIPCGMVREVSEAIGLSGLEERGIKLPLHVPSLPDLQDVAIVNAGFKFSEDSPHIDVAPPRLGEHSEEILARSASMPLSAARSSPAMTLVRRTEELPCGSLRLRAACVRPALDDCRSGRAGSPGPANTAVILAASRRARLTRVT